VSNHNPNHLPTKACVHCGRVFAWRKKWARDWANVTYCSKACRRASKPTVTGKRNRASREA